MIVALSGMVLEPDLSVCVQLRAGFHSLLDGFAAPRNLVALLNAYILRSSEKHVAFERSVDLSRFGSTCALVHFD